MYVLYRTAIYLCTIQRNVLFMIGPKILDDSQLEIRLPQSAYSSSFYHLLKIVLWSGWTSERRSWRDAMLFQLTYTPKTTTLQATYLITYLWT